VCKVEIGRETNLWGHDCKIQIAISYKASCLENYEGKLAEALFDNGSHFPGAVLDKLIKAWVREESSSSLEKFLTEYLQDNQKLAKSLREKAREVGLDLTLRLLVVEEKLLQTIDLRPLDLPVHVKDYAAEQQLTLERVSIEVDDGNKVSAILNQAKSRLLEEQVLQAVKNYFSECVSFHEFSTALHMESFKAGLIKRLNEMLKPVGRRIRTVFLNNKNAVQAQQTCLLTKKIACKVQKYPESIEIKNTVLFELNNLAKYRENSAPDLGKWLDAALNRVITDVLFDATYIDLLVNFQPKEKEIENRLREEARNIGYDIRQLIAIPDLEPIKWKENFSISPEGIFETSEAKVHVRLRIEITARINDLKQVEGYLNQRQDVPKLMEEVIIRRMRRYLHSVKPDRFYMRFYVTNLDEKVVEKELIEQVHEELKEFKVEVIDVIPKPLDTEFTNRLNELFKRPSVIRIEATPLKGGESVIFQGRFSVDGVDEDSWHKLQQREFSLEDIRKSLEQYIRSRFNTKTYEELLYKNREELDAIGMEVMKLANDCTKEEFGLAVSISVIDRERTNIENQTTNLHIARFQESIKKERLFLEHGTQAAIEENEATLNLLRKLREEREKVITEVGNEDELKELEGKIEKIKKRLQPAKMFPINKIDQKYLPGSKVADEQANEEKQQ
jgi:hypothetical protein